MQEYSGNLLVYNGKYASFNKKLQLNTFSFPDKFFTSKRSL